MTDPAARALPADPASSTYMTATPATSSSVPPSGGPTPAAPARITVGAYLATRLMQLGAPHLFGLPGDFNLSLLDEMLAIDGIEWVGTANELNAAYAADGYARIRRGIGAVVTTFGVGELSAINGVAGSFAEDVPVVKITGMPATAQQTAGALLHHTLADGNFDHFVRAYEQVTAASIVVRTATAAADIDRILLTALNESKPVYIGIPSDVAVSLVSGANLREPLELFGSNARQLARFTDALRGAVYSAARVGVLVGPRVHRRHLEPVIRSLADAPGVYVATQSGSKAILDESHPGSVGTYLGAHTQNDAARRAIDDAPLVVLAGTIMSDLLTGFFSQRFDPEQAIELAITWARVGETTFFGLQLEDSLRILDEVLQDARLDALDPISIEQAIPAPVLGDEADAAGAASQVPTLTHGSFWRDLQAFLAPQTTLVAEAGTAFFGAIDLRLPDQCDLLGQPIWSSIGYTLPATLGACIAAPDKRAVLLIGDGSAQLTVQELATILHRGHTPVIIVLNNGGYTIERAIQSPNAPYQDVTPWNWTALPAAFGAADRAVTVIARTTAEFQDALALAARTTDKLVLIEAVLPQMDSPRLLTALGAGLSEANKPGQAPASASVLVDPSAV